MRNITLSIPKEDFDSIRKGDQTEAYLDIKTHWMVRLLDCYSPGFICCSKCRCSSRNRLPKECRAIYKTFNTVIFVNGTKQDRKSFEIELKNITVGKNEANWTVDCFVLQLGNLIKTINN